MPNWLISRSIPMVFPRAVSSDILVILEQDLIEVCTIFIKNCAHISYQIKTTTKIQYDNLRSIRL